MSSQSSLDKQKLEELANFFEKQGMMVFPAFFFGRDAVKVVDKRTDKWTVSFTFFVKDDGKTFVVTSFTLDTEIVGMINQVALLVFLDNKNVDAGPSMVLFNVEPIVFPLDEFLLRLIVDKPAYFMFYFSMIQRKDVNPKLVHDIASKLWNLGLVSAVNSVLSSPSS